MTDTEEHWKESKDLLSNQAHASCYENQLASHNRGQAPCQPQQKLVAQ